MFSQGENVEWIDDEQRGRGEDSWYEQTQFARIKLPRLEKQNIYNSIVYYN